MRHLYLDVESLPDRSREHRFGLSVPKFTSVSPPEVGIPDLTVAKAKALFPDTALVPMHWLAAAELAERYSPKPRDGILEWVAALRERHGAKAKAEREASKDMATTPEQCRLCAIVAVESSGERLDWLVDETCSVEAERAGLRALWHFITKDVETRIVTFCGNHFDLPAVQVRSAMLGVPVPLRLDLSRYSKQCLDLAERRYHGTPKKGHGLSEVCQWLGIGPERDDIDGKDVETRWLAGDFQAVLHHCQRDVERLEAYHEFGALAGWWDSPSIEHPTWNKPVFAAVEADEGEPW